MVPKAKGGETSPQGESTTTQCVSQKMQTSKSLSLAKFSFLVTEADAVGTLEN